MSATSATRRNLLLAAPAVVPVVVVIAGSLGAALLQSVGLMPFAGPARFTLEPWTSNAAELARSAAVSLYIAATSTLLACIVGFAAAAYILAMPRTGRLVVAVSAATIPIPHLIGAGAVGLLLSDAGFLARILGMPDGGFPTFVGGPFWSAVIFEYAWKESAFVALVIVGSLARSVGGLCDAAATLGAAPLQRITHVVLPLALPALAVSGLIVFVYTLGSYEVPWLLGRIDPEALPVRAVRLFGSIDLDSRPQAMATALLSVLAGAVAIIGGLVLLRRMRGLR
ncbi:ABC transporter permease [Arthrobacter monumenti]